MKYEVIHPFRDKHHPEDVFYPREIIVIEDKKRAKEIFELGLIKKNKKTEAGRKIRVLKSVEIDQIHEVGEEKKKGKSIAGKNKTGIKDQT